MKIKELFGLDSELLVKWMRDSGVSHLAGDGYSITLTNILPPVKSVSEPSHFQDELEKEKLPCGHSIWEANEMGECLMGCVGKPNEDK
jgi:hypothetical protein